MPRMSEEPYEWTPRPPNTVERIGAAIWVALMGFSVANAFAGWHVFGAYDSAAPRALTLVGLLLLRLLPTVRRTSAANAWMFSTHPGATHIDR